MEAKKFNYRAVILVNIWATRCPACIEEMPSMKKLYNELKGVNLEILAVGIDAQREGLKAVAPLMKAFKVKKMVGRDMLWKK